MYSPLLGKDKAIFLTLPKLCLCISLQHWCTESQDFGNTTFIHLYSEDTRKVLAVQLLSCVHLFETPWTAARQVSLSITNSRSLPKLMSSESVMPSNNLILCHPLLLLPSIFPSIRVFSNESALRIRWPKYWNFSFSISPFNEHSGLISFKIG